MTCVRKKAKYLKRDRPSKVSPLHRVKERKPTHLSDIPLVGSYSLKKANHGHPYYKVTLSVNEPSIIVFNLIYGVVHKRRHAILGHFLPPPPIMLFLYILHHCWSCEHEPLPPPSEMMSFMDGPIYTPRNSQRCIFSRDGHVLYSIHSIQNIYRACTGIGGGR